MNRRAFIGLVGTGIAGWPLAARAQQTAKLPTIGVLSPNTSSIDSHLFGAFVQRLRELGWIEGRNVAIEYRWAEGRSERYAEIAPVSHQTDQQCVDKFTAGLNIAERSKQLVLNVLRPGWL